MRNRLWQLQLFKIVQPKVDRTLRFIVLLGSPLHLATDQSDVPTVTALGLFKFA